MAQGRPLYVPPDGYEERLYDLAKQGASLVELAVELDIARETLYNLMERDQHFLDTIKRCKVLCEDWWEKQGRSNLQNKDFNYTGWYMNMKNRFGWKDRQDVTTNDKALPTPILNLNQLRDVQSDDSDQKSS